MLSFRNITMSYSLAKGELTAITFDGADILSQLTTRDKQTEYANTKPLSTYRKLAFALSVQH